MNNNLLIILLKDYSCCAINILALDGETADCIAFELKKIFLQSRPINLETKNFRKQTKFAIWLTIHKKSYQLVGLVSFSISKLFLLKQVSGEIAVSFRFA